jgi:hypothetical protein
MAALFLSVVAVSSRTLVHHLHLADDPWRINDDARGQIPPFLKYKYPGAFSDDYSAKYFLNSFPIGYKATFALASKIKDPRWVSKALPYPLLLGLTLVVGVAARRVGGWLAAWVSMSLVLTAEVFIERTTGGLARSFAFPIVALAGLALAYGRAYWLAAAVLVGMAFYPAAAVIAGIALATLLLIVPRRDRGDAADWSFAKRISVVGTTALLSGLIYLPTALATRQYGPLLRPTQVAEYPELGNGGRLGHRDRPPFELSVGVREAAMRALSGARHKTGFLSDAGERTVWRCRLFASYTIVIIAAIVLAWRNPAGRRLAALAVAAVVGHALANVAQPQLYLPERYTLFAIPVFIALVLPAGLVALANWLLPSRARIRNVALVAVFGLLLLGMGMGMKTGSGFSHVIDGKSSALKFIKRLPPDAVVAGWPKGIMDDVPYETKRQAFLNHEIHLVFHKNYTDEMRARADALIDAYFATDLAPLLRLRDKFGVTHLVIDRRHYTRMPHYFKPFESRIPALFNAMRERGAETMRQGKAIVFKSSTFYVIRLADLHPSQTATRPATTTTTSVGKH